MLVRLLGTVTALLCLIGCQTLYHPIIHQGSKPALEHAAQLKIGMRKEQVVTLLGTPLNTAPFDENQWIYWFVQTKGGTINEKKGLHLYFQNNRLQKIRHTE